MFILSSKIIRQCILSMILGDIGALQGCSQSPAYSVEQTLVRIGGAEILEQHAKPSIEDYMYMGSLAENRLDYEMLILHTLSLCHGMKIDCISLKLSLAIIDIKQQRDEIRYGKLLDKKMIKETDFEEGCSTAHEIGSLALLESRLKKLGEAAIEQQRTESLSRILDIIHFSGGFASNMGSEQCQRLFRKKPYLAHAYLAQLALVHVRLFPRQKNEWSELLLHPNIKIINASLNAPDGSPILKGIKKPLDEESQSDIVR